MTILAYAVFVSMLTSLIGHIVEIKKVVLTAEVVSVIFSLAIGVGLIYDIFAWMEEEIE